MFDIYKYPDYGDYLCHLYIQMYNHHFQFDNLLERVDKQMLYIIHNFYAPHNYRFKMDKKQIEHYLRMGYVPKSYRPKVNALFNYLKPHLRFYYRVTADNFYTTFILYCETIEQATRAMDNHIQNGRNPKLCVAFKPYSKKVFTERDVRLYNERIDKNEKQK